MFLRPLYRRRNGQREAYWALVESYRTQRGPRQRTIAYLGRMDDAGRLGVQQAADPQPPARQHELFPQAAAEPRFVEVDRTRMRVENCRQFGAPWLALELVKRLGLHEFFERTLPTGQEHVPWSSTASILVIARLCEPSSELHIAEHFYRQSALSDLLGVPIDKVDDNRLDRGLDELLPHKPALEVFLKERFGELFAIEYDLLLYDVTSTYFEGQAKANPLATPKSQLKRFEQQLAAQDWHVIREGLEVKLCPCPEGGSETYILCRSDRREKEQAMHARFEKRVEEGLTKIAAGCAKRAHKLGEIERRVGRLLGQNTRAAGLFDIQISATANGAAQVSWKKVEAWRAWAQLSEGSYGLRSNVTDWSDEDLWRAYIQLTDAETAFRIQKSDLSLRPVWHQKQDRVLAHILVCFLAFVLWKLLGQLCQRAGLGNEPRRVLDELSELRVVDVVLPTKDGCEIRTRCVTRPSDHQKILLERLGLELPNHLHLNPL